MTQNRKRVGLSVPIALYQKLASEAEYYGKTINALCIDIFWQWLEQKAR